MKKLLTILLSVLMAFSLCACGGSEEEATAIKIGASGPLTGGAAVYGIAVKNAAEMAVEEINAKGGLQFELNFQDDAHDAEKAVSAYGVIYDWGMQVSLGTVTSAPGAAVSSKYKEDGIFALTPSASSTAVTLENINDPNSSYGNVFQMCFSDPNQGSSSAQYIADNKLGTKVAVIYKNDDSYSAGIYNKFEAKAKELGIEVVYAGTFNDANANDFNVQLTQAQAAGAEIVFLPIYYEPASLILAQANQMNYNPIFFGVDGMDGILSLDGFDKSLAEGVYLLTPFSADATDELTANFVKNYTAKYGETPIQFAADAYDCVYAIAQACEAGGVTYDMSAQDICDIMIKQFTSMEFTGTTGVNATWNAAGEVTKSPKAVIIKNGVYVGA